MKVPHSGTSSGCLRLVYEITQLGASLPSTFVGAGVAKRFHSKKVAGGMQWTQADTTEETAEVNYWRSHRSCSPAFQTPCSIDYSTD